jgi:hypothetical protein
MEGTAQLLLNQSDIVRVGAFEYVPSAKQLMDKYNLVVADFPFAKFFILGNYITFTPFEEVIVPTPLQLTNWVQFRVPFFAMRIETPQHIT